MRRRHGRIRSEEARYGAGESVHWIQAKKAFQDKASWRAAEVVDVGDDGVTLVVVGEKRRYRCVDAPRLGAALTARSVVRITEAWSLLSVAGSSDGGVLPGVTRLEGGQSVEAATRRGTGRWLFSVKRLDSGAPSA